MRDRYRFAQRDAAAQRARTQDGDGAGGDVLGKFERHGKAPGISLATNCEPVQIARTLTNGTPVSWLTYTKHQIKHLALTSAPPYREHWAKSERHVCRVPHLPGRGR